MKYLIPFSTITIMDKDTNIIAKEHYNIKIIAKVNLGEHYK